MSLFIDKEIEFDLDYVFYYHLTYECLEFDLV
jgi:hypothetical protein